VKNEKNEKNKEKNKSFRNFKYTKYKASEQIREKEEESAFLGINLNHIKSL
jgi:hypothetical protein